MVLRWEAGTAGGLLRRLRGAFAEDVPAARETLRLLLDGPALAVPLMVNGEPRYLVRGRLSAGIVHSSLTTPNYGGDPKGIFAELEAALVVEVVG